MSLPLYLVDAFTNRPFSGNPAAVCLLPSGDWPADGWMQAVGAEMNLSETAFLLPPATGEVFGLRWFTPKVEVDLCGHATLASAHILWEHGVLSPEAVARFATRSGDLTARRVGEWIELDFPSKPVEPIAPPTGLLPALGLETGDVQFIGLNKMDYLLEVSSEAKVRALTPEFAALAGLPVRGVIVTALAQGGEFDFVSRFFAPAAGINEDPVTGSAHCALAPYWGAKLGKTELLGCQISARGGVVRCQLAGERVLLGGQAVTVTRGELVAP